MDLSPHAMAWAIANSASAMRYYVPSELMQKRAKVVYGRQKRVGNGIGGVWH